MDKPSANVGRSRGRAGSGNQPASTGGRGRRPAQMAQAPGGLPAPEAAGSAPFAWGNPNVGGARGSSRGGVVMSAAQPTAIAQQRPPAPVTLGRATTHRDVPDVETQGAVGTEDNRGVVRGKRVIAELVHSRPRDLKTKCGTIGDKVSVQTNYFRILRTPLWSIHQYRVDFSPDVDMVRLRRAYLAQHKDLFGGYIFDGTLLFCTNFFMDQAENGQKELLTKNREGETIQIKIKHVGIVDVSDAQQIQVLNLILRRAMEGLQLQLVGRNFFDPVAKINLDSYRMELWPGYQTSIRQHERDILLCAEITHKVMRTQTLYQILSDCSRDFQDFQTGFKQQVVGTVVLTDYNNKTYRVDDVDFKASPMSKFATKDGEISYIEYYKKRYNIHIRDQNQPMLISRPTERNIRGGQNEFIMLIPELCRATGITDAMRNNFKLMRAMGDYTRLNPDRRMERLRTFNDRLHSSKASMEVFSLWNMKLDTSLVEIPGRILPPEKIVFGNQRKVPCDRNADWQREFRKNTMYSQVDIKRWYVIVPRRNLREVQDFVKMCIQAARSMKMHISEPRYEEMPDDRNGSYSQAIDKTTAQDPQILMLVLVNNNEEKYSCIKKKCCVDRPVPSQVCTLRTIAPRGDKAAGLMSIATKIVIQMNAKLMGAPWMIDMPLSGLMTVGFDVCHSAKEKNKSYGALVATMDIKQSTKYFSAVTQHLKGQELSNEISVKMTCALKAYRATHGTLPERILFFRDGVGDGQLHQVFSTEVKFLKNKLDEIYKSAGFEKGCRLAFIIVSKRINTRYFLNNQNPVPGTVVDDIITLPERYDFFLVSQSVKQGTVSPTSYNVIYDNMGLSPDKIQILTYKMTHLYYNWSGTLRVPAVCQYAHKLAFLVAESIHRAPNNVLENQLYFL
ncbi:protein aubergine [Calliphora vicina]|uniref:protein aubergine n=1 Tax=Calliphora vicina TaxID=7373 RepID=UPI00325B4F7B